MGTGYLSFRRCAALWNVVKVVPTQDDSTNPLCVRPECPPDVSLVTESSRSLHFSVASEDRGLLLSENGGSVVFEEGKVLAFFPPRPSRQDERSIYCCVLFWCHARRSKAAAAAAVAAAGRLSRSLQSHPLVRSATIAGEIRPSAELTPAPLSPFAASRHSGEAASEPSNKFVACEDCRVFKIYMK